MHERDDERRRAGRQIALSYLAIAGLLVVLVALVNAPFMVADEPNHFFRAAQISHGGFIGIKWPNGEAGGLLPQPVENFGYAFGAMPFNQGVRTDLAQVKSVYHDGWRGVPAAVSFANTVIYPPFFYLPAAVALYVTRHLHLHLVQCFYLARIVSGLVCVSLSALALRLCAAPARPWLLFCLCLPEVLGLYGSLSQDGPFIACAVLAMALLSRCAWPQAEVAAGALLGAVALLALFVSAKPPYLPVLLLPLVLVSRRRLSLAAGAVGLGIAFVLAWAIFGMHPLLSVMRVADISPGRQLHSLLTHPHLVLEVLHNSFITGGGNLIATAIATMSWVDAGMPAWFYALVGLIGAALALLYAGLLLASTGLEGRLRLLAVLLLVIGAGAGASLSTYLTWDEVGRNAIWGLNGRYFTAAIVFLTPGAALAGHGWVSERLLPRLSQGLVWLLLPFTGLCYLAALFLRFWWPT